MQSSEQLPRFPCMSAIRSIHLLSVLTQQFDQHPKPGLQFDAKRIIAAPPEHIGCGAGGGNPLFGYAGESPTSRCSRSSVAFN